ncbi:outer membrane lipoprotein-sorting protein [Treponema sp. OMZ 792]|uniref:outer membrane lipoprotein-sorting protein n=1 Tax=unclassified Treponema TaxID=2638727 RepID=UPI0020A5202C|nr:MULTISPECIES: outer membrane lipoprotein-sorting protein [unclassified Treponema]UTC75827.1 outer membrane lipoprotein-sorting protein [Treponema sp. OMZ 792]UTC79828.1 outer membrane lipoprotein-sorting protein [Treponema sp. OMZ 798]
MKKIVMILLAAVIALGAGFAQELTGRDIMQKASNREKAVTDSFKMRMTLINSNGKKRVREVTAYSKDYGKEEKIVMVFLLPADVKGTGYLAYSYDDALKNDDRWLYIPALKKAKRISGSSSQDDFMGTEFTYEDMGSRKVDDYKHTLLGEEKIDSKDCWKIESVPVKKSMYSKFISWIDKESLLNIKAEFYDEQGAILKELTVSGIEKKDGFWTGNKMEMNNLQKKRKTVIEILKHEFNKEIPDSYFRVNSLEAGKIKN